MTMLRNALAWFDQLTADVFWTSATSYPALVLLGLVAGVAFVVAHLPLVEKLFPPVAPYIRAASLASVVAASALLFLVGFRVADARREVDQLRTELLWKTVQIENLDATARDAERLRQQADARLAETKGQLDEWRTIYGDKPEAACAFTPDDLGRLRVLQRRRARQP
jgi:hypothetical protein